MESYPGVTLCGTGISCECGMELRVGSGIGDSPTQSIQSF